MKRTPVKLRIPRKKVEEICRQNDIIELSLFGSFARGEGRKRSDVDLLVLFDPDAHFGLIKYFGIQEELTTAFGRKVDLIEKTSLKPDIRREVLADAKVLFAA